MGMTNEEIESCIQTLRFLENTFLDDHGIFLNDKHPDNIEKIITFLHESPCEDCISRQAVLDQKELVELEDGQSFYCINPKDVETLPSVMPKQTRWIPASERLPNAYEFVNCTCHSLIDDREDWVIETVYIPQPSYSPYSD